MKTSIVIIGLLVLLVGGAVMAYGEYTPVSGQTTSTTQTTITLVPSTNRVIGANGIWSSGAVEIQKGEAVSGTFSITNYSSSKGPVFFYIMNEPQFAAWGACAPCASSFLENYTAPSSGSYSFTWSAPATGPFLFVFDNGAYNAAAPATFSSTGQYQGSTTVATSSPNWTVIYAGAALVAVGAIGMAAGVVMSGKKAAAS